MRAPVYWIADLLGGRLAIVGRPRGGDWLGDELGALRDAGIDVLVSLLQRREAIELGLGDEPALAEEHGLRFLTLPIPDFGVPTFEQAGELILRLRQELAAGRGVGVHCRGSIGRSGMITAAVLTLTGSTPGEACGRVSAARGLAVPETAAQVAWVEEFARRMVIP